MLINIYILYLININMYKNILILNLNPLIYEKITKMKTFVDK